MVEATISRYINAVVVQLTSGSICIAVPLIYRKVERQSDFALIGEARFAIRRELISILRKSPKHMIVNLRDHNLFDYGFLTESGILQKEFDFPVFEPNRFKDEESI
jgi:hypothetical protein